jgi:microcystin degradation protein MlrC
VRNIQEGEEAEPMRIVTGGIAQESNTFQWEPTTLADFQKGSSRIARSEQILALDGTRAIYGGIVPAAREHGAELIPTTYGVAVPGGRVSRAAFETLRDEVLDGIRQAQASGGVDGVLLGIHDATHAATVQEHGSKQHDICLHDMHGHIALR